MANSFLFRGGFYTRLPMVLTATWGTLMTPGRFVKCAWLALALVLAHPSFVTYEQTGLVLSMGITLLAFLRLGGGIILDTVSRSRQDLKRLRYLSFPAVPRELSEAGAQEMEPERELSVS